jgi:hypothetical protein
MNDDEFKDFRRSLDRISKSLMSEDELSSYLKEIFEKYGIPELTAEQRGRVRKCRAPLSRVARLFDEYKLIHTYAAGVYQPSHRYLSLYCCRELNTLVFKTMFSSSGVSRWGMREENFTYIKFLTHDAAAELIIKHKDSMEVFSQWERPEI